MAQIHVSLWDLSIKLTQVLVVSLVDLLVAAFMHFGEHLVDSLSECFCHIFLIDNFSPPCLLEVLVLSQMAQLIELEAPHMDGVLELETTSTSQQEVAFVLYLDWIYLVRSALLKSIGSDIKSLDSDEALLILDP